MADWPVIDGQYWVDGGSVTASSEGTTLTANSSANVKATSFTTLVASTDVHTKMLVVTLSLNTAAARDSLIDIAIGPALSETVLISNLLCSVGSIDPWPVYYIPVNIPAGTRISARMQCSTGSATLKVHLLLAAHSWLPSSPLCTITTYGANTSDSGGTPVDPGTSANTKGLWTEISASTTMPIKLLIPALGVQRDAGRTDSSFLLDIGVGVSTSEKAIIRNLWFGIRATPDQTMPPCWHLPVNIPAGTRLTARAQSSITNADRTFDLILYGVG